MTVNPTSNNAKTGDEMLDPADTRWLQYPVVRLLISMRTKTVRKEVYALSPEQCVKLKDDIEKGKALADAINAKLGVRREGPNIWDEVVEVIDQRLNVDRARAEGRLSGDLFQRAKSVVDIVAFAGKYTKLIPSGDLKFKGVCPLHDEKTPSFYVDGHRQSWRCFGACGDGGDVVKLAAKLKQAGKR